MKNQIIPAALIGTLASASGLHADTKDDVLYALNGVLESGNQTVVIGDKTTIDIGAGNLRYNFDESERSGCREFSGDFDNNQGTVGANLCLSTQIQSHELTYPLVSTTNSELRFGAGVSIYSNLVATAGAYISHPEIETYSKSVSEHVGDTLYDPFISAEFHTQYGLGNDTFIYGDIEGKYGMYTHSGSAEIGLAQEFGNITLSGALGMSTFGVHDGGINGELSDVLLGGDTGYIEVGASHCFGRMNVCPSIIVQHGVSGVGEGNTGVNVNLGVNF